WSIPAARSAARHPPKPKRLHPCGRVARVIRLFPDARESGHRVPPTLPPGLFALRRNVRDDSGLPRGSKDSELCSHPSGELRLCRVFARIVQRRLTNIQTRPASAVPRCLKTTRASKRLGSVFFRRRYCRDQLESASERD